MRSPASSLVPVQRVAAYAVVEVDARVLLVRGPTAAEPVRWFLPGGGVEHGEHPRDAVRRELAEEAGLRVSVGELLAVYSDVTEVPEEGWLLHSVRLVYSAQVRPGPTTRPADVVAWVSRAQASRMSLMPFVADALALQRA